MARDAPVTRICLLCHAAFVHTWAAIQALGMSASEVEPGLEQSRPQYVLRLAEGPSTHLHGANDRQSGVLNHL